MNSSQESRLNMYHAVISHCETNNVIVATVPAFAAILNSFKAKASSITYTAQLEAQVITGVAMDKKFFRTSLIQQGADLAAVVYAFADSTGNNTLKEQVNFNHSDLLRLRDDQLAPTCRNIWQAADSNIAGLAAYGITAAMVGDFDSWIDDYEAKVPSPRNAAALRKTYAAALKTLFKEANGILKNQMDKVAVQFKAANLGFYDTYKNNRIIIDAATSATQLTGTVVNGTTPVSGVKVRVVDRLFATTTDANGEYILKIPIPGTYSIQFSHTGYPDNTVHNIKITLGQSTTLNTNLAPL